MNEAQLRSIVKNNIKRLRINRQWTQAQFAEKASLSVNFICDLEAGKRWFSPASMVKIAALLKIEPYELFMPEGDCIPPKGITMLKNYSKELKQMMLDSFDFVYNRYVPPNHESADTALECWRGIF